MTTETYPSGKVVGYEYDSKGELVSLSIDGTPFIKNIKTNDNGLLSYEYADGSKHTREYDTNGRVTKLNYPNYTEEVNYNQVSNITSIKSDAISRAFRYDNLDRLTSYEQNATDFQNFVYDANGNRVNQSQDNNESKLFTYASNSNILNSIKESNTTDTKDINYEYDKTGNIIKDDKHTYSYDSRNRLIAIDSNVTYQYNYDNKRVSKTVNGVKSYFIYDGHKLIGEYKLNLSNESRQEYIYLNSTPIATMTPTKTYRVYADHLDTSRRVATNESNAEIVWKWESKPFGESKASGDISFNLRFPGQYFDNETGTHYNINRDYNPVTGRYIQSDPIGFDGGVNGFGYVGGSPISSVDLRGLRKLTYGEVQLASSIFGNTINYNDVNIYQENWAGFIPVPSGRAMTPWGDMYFDTSNKYYSSDFSKKHYGYKALFIHEMVHVWQYQNGYPLNVLIGAVASLSAGYTYNINYRSFYDGGTEYVTLYSQFSDFNIEQQGNIVMDYFLLKNGVTIGHNWWGSQTQSGIGYQTASYGALYFTVTNAGIQ